MGLEIYFVKVETILHLQSSEFNFTDLGYESFSPRTVLFDDIAGVWIGCAQLLDLERLCYIPWLLLEFVDVINFVIEELLECWRVDVIKLCEYVEYCVKLLLGDGRLIE